MRADTYQILLILSGVAVASLFGVFLYREVFPEYKIYQNDYIALENFRSTYMHQPPPPFQTGIKQIVIEREDKGPATIDRCISCHVALQIPYFSPTKIANDLNGNIVRDEKGHPLLVPNEEYIWGKLDRSIADLRDSRGLEQLEKEGKSEEIAQRLSQATKYEALKTAHVGNQVYDVSKVLAMHPLMGNEIYPFQFHPIEEYGCTSCHNGNGRGLVTDKAHGPVFDGQYAAEKMGHTRFFTESDPNNDPRFSQVFNHKPDDHLIFQTEPLFVGSLIQAKCVQCHQNSEIKFSEAKTSISNIVQKKEQKVKVLTEAYLNEKKVLVDLLQLQRSVDEDGYAKTIDLLKKMEINYLLPALDQEHSSSQIKYLEQIARSNQNEEVSKSRVLSKLNEDLVNILGSDALVKSLEEVYRIKGEPGIDEFLKTHQSSTQADGSIFTLGAALDLNQDLLRHTRENELSFSKAASDEKLMNSIVSDVDELTRNFQRGKDLYLSQACYACHRISGFSRGGVGPELTRAGENYPWFLKRKLSWPQGDLPTSTMPNMHFDSRELEDLMTFLLAQKGGNRAISKTDYQTSLQAWESGRKQEWEKPLSPSHMYDLRNAKEVFATQGCAACHRLQGFESNVGFAVEKEGADAKKIDDEQRWFRSLFPEVVHFSYYDEELPGSEIVSVIEKNTQDIDTKIVDNVRENSILEEINKKFPETLESLYSPFRYAARAKNNYFQKLIHEATDPEKISQLNIEWQSWKKRVHRIMMMYIQIYGLGRLIGPHLNWSGIYRSDEWLMEHFHNPPGHVPRSLMPVFPFDDTKFYALTHMLDVLAVRNRNALRRIWEFRGFDPSEAYDMLCAQCHGVGRVGNGVIAEWIYPIPKNLHNPEFLRNLTKERVAESIRHGIRGTPMPPWGEVAKDKTGEIKKLSQNKPVLTDAEINFMVDWLFTGLSGSQVIRKSADVPKWQYTPEDVLKELEKEGGRLVPLEKKEEGDEEPVNEIEENGSSKKQENLRRNARFFGLNAMPSFGIDVGKEYFASSDPSATFRHVFDKMNSKIKNKIRVEDIFNVIPDPAQPGQDNYFIKKHYYTPENIEMGQKFFLLNCAVCHGNEADGTGTRSQAMQEAKPRMLTNLDWVNSRDDLRLLRSIKYGVPGTSMTPWGDLTSSLQRLQLVIFIRSLTQENEKRSELMSALYQTFDTSLQEIENARIEGSKRLEELKKELASLRMEQERLERGVKEGRNEPQNVSQVYQQSLEVEQKIFKWLEQDQKLALMKEKLKIERDLYHHLGVNLGGKDLSDKSLQLYFKLVRSNENRYKSEREHLIIQFDKSQMDQIRRLRKEIMDEIDKKIEEMERQRKVLEGRISSAQQREELRLNQNEIDSYKKLQAKLITNIEEAMRLAQEQKQGFN